MRGSRGVRGFTLIELMVALFAMALLAVMSWRGLDGMSRAQAQTEARSSEVLTLQVGSLEETIQVTARRPRNPVAAATQSTGRVRVGGNIKVPRKIFHASPIYPEAMREAGLEGVVKLDVLIGIDGIVQSVRVVGAQVHPAFAQSASDAVKQWKFTPTLLNGQPVEVEMTASISFGLTDQ